MIFIPRGRPKLIFLYIKITKGCKKRMSSNRTHSKFSNMASEELKMCNITEKLIPNKLIEREDDFTLNVIYLANRKVKCLCMFFAKSNGKFIPSELGSAYKGIETQALTELYSLFCLEIE